MDVLRHTGRAQLQLVRRRRRPATARWTARSGRSRPYTEADLQRQIDHAPTRLRRPRPPARRRRHALRRGHQRLHRRSARSTRRKLPAEYAALGKPPDDWTPDRRDRRGVADRRHLRQGRRRRAALARCCCRRSRSASARRRAAARGATSARRTTPRRRPRSASKRFPYETGVAVRQARARAARPRLGARSRRPSPPPGRQRRRAATRAAVGARARRARCRARPHASNWELVSGARVDDRPPDRRDRPAGRLLRAPDPDGGGPPRPAASTRAARRSRA